MKRILQYVILSVAFVVYLIDKFFDAVESIFTGGERVRELEERVENLERNK